jgi:excisionase family DNA binding protein
MEVKHYYRISEVARLLSVSARSIKRATNNGKIPCTKISDKVTLISSSDVEKLKQKQVIRKYKSQSPKQKLPQKIKSSPSQSEIAKPKKTNKSDSENKKLMADVNEIVEVWNNTAKICKCRKVTNEIIKAAKKRLETYSLEEIKTIILNYQTILQDENTYFTYAWNLYEFLTRAKSFEYFNDDIIVLADKYRKFDAGDSDEQKDDDKWNWSFPQPKEWDSWSLEERKTYIKNKCVKETK